MAFTHAIKQRVKIWLFALFMVYLGSISLNSFYERSSRSYRERKLSLLSQIHTGDIVTLFGGQYRFTVLNQIEISNVYHEKFKPGSDCYSSTTQTLMVIGKDESNYQVIVRLTAILSEYPLYGSCPMGAIVAMEVDSFIHTLPMSRQEAIYDLVNAKEQKPPEAVQPKIKEKKKTKVASQFWKKDTVPKIKNLDDEDQSHRSDRDY